MSKKIPTGTIKLNVPAQKANPAPPIGPALGQKQVNIMDFCKKFNDKTKNMEAGTPLPVIIHVYKDKSFDITIKKPTVSYYLQKACGIEKGSSSAGKTDPIAEVTEAQCLDIAKEKISEMNATSLESAVKIVKGSARSMGLKVIP